jgi:hypothetical protein
MDVNNGGRMWRGATTIASAERENFEHLPNLQLGGNDHFRAL